MEGSLANELGETAYSRNSHIHCLFTSAAALATTAAAGQARIAAKGSQNKGRVTSVAAIVKSDPTALSCSDKTSCFNRSLHSSHCHVHTKWELRPNKAVG